MDKRYIIEAIGTFFLVLVIALTGSPLAIGAILTAMVYMGGHISGGHFNPAVTLAVYIRGSLKQYDALRYVLAQVVGGFLAALVYLIVQDVAFVPKPPVTSDALPILLIEILFTYILATVVLQVGTSAKTKGNSYFGIAIGFTLLAIVFAGGPISGAVYNPAVAVGPFIVDIANFNANLPDLLLYLIGPLVGGYIAGLTYKYIE
jgi:aquaporin Z